MYFIYNIYISLYNYLIMTTPTPTDADDDGDFNDQSITVS